MALLETTEREYQKLVIKHYSLCYESTDPKEGYEDVLVTNPRTGEQKTKFIKRFAGVTGVIVGIKWYDRANEYGTFRGINLHFKDGGQHFYLDLPLQSKGFDVFTRVMENIDYAKPVGVRVFKSHKNGKDETAIVWSQGDENLQWRYTKADPGDAPQPKQLRSGQWDYTARSEFLLAKLQDEIIPMVNELHAFTDPEPEYDEEEVAETSKIQQIVAPKAKAAKASADDLAPGEPPLYPNGTPDDDDLDSFMPF